MTLSSDDNVRLGTDHIRSVAGNLLDMARAHIQEEQQKVAAAAIGGHKNALEGSLDGFRKARAWKATVEQEISNIMVRSAEQLVRLASCRPITQPECNRHVGASVGADQPGF
jgi:hypothetical protein